MKICYSPSVIAALLLSACQTPSSSIAEGAIESKAPAHIFELSEVNEEPTPISRPAPVFPKPLMRAGVSGVAQIQFVVLADGRVYQAKAVSATHPLFAESAVTAVSKSRFKPAIKDASPVAVRMAVPITFRLNER
jgi:TonB family protein